MRRTLLIVDDIRINREILKKMLEREYEILEATNGIEAMDEMRRSYRTLSAVLLDLSMPVMNGFDVMARMREDEELSHLPVIVTTGQTEEESEVKALSLGANDYITKPYNSTIIKQRIRNTINLRETAAMVNVLQRDRMTGLYTREVYLEKVGEMIAGKAPGSHVIISLDIDHFKVINDQYGMKMGDRVLRHVGERLQSAMEQIGGIASRIAADNFSVCYESDAAHEDAVTRCLREIATPSCLDFQVSVRIGRYRINDPSLSPSILFDRAAIAEASVRGHYEMSVAEYDESMRVAILQEQKIVNDMRTALTDNQFELWFQPQFNHATGALIGAEALVRWRHPKEGLIPPGVFIPVFERNGFIYEMDKYVWEQACRCLRRWLDEGREPLPISVNISRYDLFRGDLIAHITELVARYRVPVELLRLEITESAFTEDAEHVIDVVEGFARNGFTVELDDFGSGYSSLNTLKDVPAHVLKLDMRFLQTGHNSERGGSILESIVRMAKWLGMPVIAEGVETIEQANFLKSIGCVYIQGFLYARPMPVEAYEAFVSGYDKEREMKRLELLVNLDSNAFWNPESMETLIFNSYVGAACVFEYHNGQTELLRANENYVRELGRGEPSDDARLIDIQAYLDDDNRAILIANTESSIRTGKESTCEVCLTGLLAEGQHTYMRSTVRLIARAGERYLFYASILNMTAQREAERNERDADERMRSVMDDTPGGFCQMRIGQDRTAQIVFVNSSFCRLVGMSKETIMERFGDDALRGVHPEDARVIRELYRKGVVTGETIHAPCRMVSGEDGYVTTLFFGRIIRMGSGEMFVNAFYTSAAVPLLSDGRSPEPTEERTLSPEKAAYARMVPTIFTAMMDSTGDLSFAKDRELRYLCASRPFLRMIGLGSADELVGKTDYDIFDKATADQYRGDDIRLIASGAPIVEKLEAIPSDDGVQHHSSTSKYLLYDAEGQVIGLYGVGRDVTEYRMAFDQLKLLTETMPCGIATFEILPDGLRNIYFNEGFFSFSGYAREEFERLIAKDPMALILPEDRGPLLAGIDAIRHGERLAEEYAFRCREKDGGARWMSLKIVLPDADDDRLVIHVVQYDITQRKLKEEELRMSEEQYRIAMKQSGNIMCRFDVADRSVNMSPEVAQYFGMPEKVADVPYEPVRRGLIAPDSEKSYVELYESILRGEKTHTAEIETMTAQGWRWFKIIQTTVFSDDGAPVYAVVSLEDVTLRQRREKEHEALVQSERILQRLADTDGMTGAYNKTAAEARIRERIAMGAPCAMLIIDIDDLKLINDTLGHPQGDRAIRRVADVIESHFRRSDIIGRIGGDEFIIFLDNMDDKERLGHMIAKLVGRVDEARIGEEDEYPLHISVGAAVSRDGELTFEEMYARADKGLYYAKRNGKQQYAFYMPQTNEGDASS